MSVIQGGAIADAGGAYNIANSLRLRAAASGKLSRTPSSSGNLTTWTFSAWVKRGAIGNTRTPLLQTGTASNDTGTLSIGFWNTGSNDVLFVSGGATTFRVSNALARDPSGWYHVVVAVDTTQATANNRIRLYINGAEITSFATLNNPGLGASLAVNLNQAHNIGYDQNGAIYADAVFADVRHVSGYQLTASDFGQASPTNSKQWTPKAYSGSYGTHGFYLPFSNGTSTTTLGYDSSGNGNNWTLSGISITSGVTYDWFTDTPTNNYCVLNAIDKDPSGNLVLSYSNLRAYASATTYQYGVRGSIGVSSGVWCWEITATVAATFIAGITSNPYPFVSSMDAFVSGVIATGTHGFRSDSATKYVNGTQTSYGSIFGNGDVMAFVLDMTAGTLTGYRNGVSQGVIVSGLSGTFFPLLACWSGGTADVNFGQRPFAYTYGTAKPICTNNLTDTTVTTSGSFAGTATTDGTCKWLNGYPTSLTINGNAVTWGTHADRWAGGFKLRTSSASYNASGSNTFTATFDSPSSNQAFKNANAQTN